MKKFSNADKALLIGALGAILADVETTKRGIAAGKKERNPILGERPSNAKLNTAGILSGIATIGAAYGIDPQYRAGLLGGISGFRLATAHQNTKDERFSGYGDAIKKPLAAGILSGVLSHLMLSQDEDASVMIEPQKKGATITYRRKF